MMHRLDRRAVRWAVLAAGLLALAGVLTVGRVILVYEADCDLPLRVLYPIRLPAPDELNAEWTRHSCGEGMTAITDDAQWRTYFFDIERRLVAVRVVSDIPEFCDGTSIDRWFGSRIPLRAIATCH